MDTQGLDILVRDSDLVVTGLDLVMVDTLFRLPGLIEEDHRSLAGRVEGDLAKLEPGTREGSWNLPLPADHVGHWLAALAAAKPALHRRHRLAASDLEAEGGVDPEADPQRVVAHVQLNVMGFLQALIRPYHRDDVP